MSRLQQRIQIYERLSKDDKLRLLHIEIQNCETDGVRQLYRYVQEVVLTVKVINEGPIQNYC